MSARTQGATANHRHFIQIRGNQIDYRPVSQGGRLHTAQIRRVYDPRDMLDISILVFYLISFPVFEHVHRLRKPLQLPVTLKRVHLCPHEQRFYPVYWCYI